MTPAEAAELTGRPVPWTRPLRHGLTAVYLPSAMPAVERQQVLDALGVPPRPTRRKRTA